MNQAGYKKLVKNFLVALALLGALLACIAIAFIVVDPLQLYHRSCFMPANMLSGNMREQAAGLIRNYDFDSIILGTSVLQNTPADEAASKLGGKFMNISIEGGSYYERSFLLDMALRKGLRSVIFSGDDHYLGPYIENPLYPARDWAYLYDENRLNDLRRYATRQKIFELFKKDKGLQKVDLNYPKAWFTLDTEVKGFGGIEKWAENVDDVFVREFLRDLPKVAAAAARGEEGEIGSNPERERKAREYIDNYIMKFVRKYPQTQFYFLLTPYFRYHYARWLKTAPEDFYIHQAVARYLAQMAREHPNFHVFGFEDEDFPDDIASYKDPVHFNRAINSRMLDSIASGKNSLTPENVEAYLEKSLIKARKFDIPALNSQFNQLLNAAKKEGG